MKNLLKLDIQHFASSGAMSTTNQYVKYNITVTENWQDKINAISNVTVEVRVWRTNTGYETWGSGTCYVKIDGTTYSSAITTSQKFTYNSNTLVFTKTLNIQHDTDGKKNLICSAWINHAVFSSNEQSYSQTLTYIPRASVLGTISNFTIGNDITIPVTKYSSDFSDTLNVYVGDTWVKKIEGLTNGQKINFTTAELNTIYANIPNSATAIFKFVNTTYSGPNVLGTNTKTATGTIPSGIKPTISSVTIVEGNTDVVPSSWDVYVQNKSKIKIVVNAIAGTGSNIASITTNFDGVSYIGSEFTSNVITNNGDMNATILVTDTRGRTTQIDKSIHVQEYKEPYIDTFSVIRCNEDGTDNDSGVYTKVRLAGGVYSVNGKNTSAYKVKYKKTIEDEYQTYTFNISGTSIDETVILNDISTDNTYNFIANISDYFTSDNPTKKETTLASQFVLMDYLNGGHGIAFGKVAEKEWVMDINLNIRDLYGTDIGNGLANYTGAGDEAIDPDTTLEHLVLTNKNTPTTGFSYVQTFFYKTKSTTANRSQIAVPYSNEGSIYYRYYYDGAWSEWKTNKENKDLIRVVLSSNVTMPSGSYTTIPFNDIAEQINEHNSFSFNNNGAITITNDKVRRVRIYLSVFDNNWSSDAIYLTIKKNGYVSKRLYINGQSNAHLDAEILVKKDDVITTEFYSGSQRVLPNNWEYMQMVVSVS